MLRLYDNLLADVRWDENYHGIRGLVQPQNPLVKKIADVLINAPDFIEATQDFVHTYTTYESEIGDFWAMPEEMLDKRSGDCDDSAILVCSILRNYIPADQVFCAVGVKRNGKTEGHMWVQLNTGGDDFIVESTAGSNAPLRGKYVLSALFNDKYAFATENGLKEFGLVPVLLEEKAYEKLRV